MMKAKAQKRGIGKFLINYEDARWSVADATNVNKGSDGVITEVTFTRKWLDSNRSFTCSRADFRGGKVSLAGIDTW